MSEHQDRDKGVVTLKGTVPSDEEKMRAESIAKGQAEAIDKNLDAALVENRLSKTVKYSVKNGVVTLKGHVDSQAARSEAAHIAASVPNVAQVVNEVEVRHIRATSSRQQAVIAKTPSLCATLKKDAGALRSPPFYCPSHI